ncbi:choice-of-anchor L domain-containing protein [Flavobacterium sp. CBA20B-1]|uniref:choice-of-anchor L domain-containing protein n=1 Tax=unclassified Flavobacterium TaxID=196869 RepID=UPI0022253E83|nr:MULTISPECIES: choice-of-anchor L domain-containing protein [unclassified Flavobacterium]WCM41309.1 choice-of-anchor L domain-containing protein [Flavobacterium sp. CBA20B-1]
MNQIINNINRCLLVFLLVFTTTDMYAQTPVQATIENTNPTDAQILSALNGGGMTMYLGTGDGLVRGVRNRQIATFSNGLNAGFGMDEGILLTTGRASEDLASRNNTTNKSYQAQSNTYTDSDLTGIFNQATRDVVIYKFKVTLASHTTAIRAVFQFGSEEYPDFVGSQFNDAFGFFVRPISGGATLPGGASVINMARLPHSNNPISINTVNYGYAGSSGSATYSGLDLTQSEHYMVNGHTTTVNSNGRLNSNTNPGPFPVFIEYNGLTKLITYDLKNLTPGGTYEFKIAIADAGDTQYDSGVLLKKVQGTTGADVKIEKVIDMMDPAYGDEIEFTLTASNLGPYDAKGAVVQDVLPNGYTYVSHIADKGTYNTATGEWSIGDIQAIFEEAELKIRATVNNTGNYTNVATIVSDEPDPDYSNNTAVMTPNPLCYEELVFYDDFGQSNSSINGGRTTSAYMPANSFTFANAYPTSTNDGQTAIDNNHYAVVSPGYIKNGWNPANLSWYFWTPAFYGENGPEAGAVTDISGTEEGAVMVINGGETLDAFYARDINVVQGETYRASMWMYLVKGPARIAIDIKEKDTGKIMGIYTTETFEDWGSTKGKWINVELYFSVPTVAEAPCGIGDLVLEFRNDLDASFGNDYYIDNITLTRLGSLCPMPATPLVIECPKPPIVVTNPMLRSRGTKNK